MLECLSQAYRHRALVQVLILRELKARYRGTALGFLWSFVNPLILMMIYVLVFSVYLRVDVPHYPVFLLCGILPWAWFSSALNESTHSIISNAGLIKKVYLPSEIFPLVYVGSHAVHYLLSVPILFFFMAFFGIPLSWWLLTFPIIVFIQFMFTYRLALFASSLAVQFRDLLHIVPNILMIAFFLTPILYPASTVPATYLPLLELNPLAQLVMSYQDILFYGRMPSPGGLTMLAALACVLLVLGLAFFGARKDVFAEEV